MDRASRLELVAALLAAETTLTLATADGSGIANASPLFFIADKHCCLYWFSSNNSLHSQNLQRQPQVSIAIHRHADDWKRICGMQMSGSVSAVTDEPLRKKLMTAYSKRFQLTALFHPVLALSTLYAFRPDHLHYMDNSRHFGFKFELNFDHSIEDQLLHEDAGEEADSHAG